MKLEYTSTALRGPDYKDKIKEARAFCDKNGFEFGVQMHNSASVEQVEAIYQEGVPLSFHAPIGGQYNINLATKNLGPSLKSLEDTVSLMERYKVKLAVFHGFTMYDEPIPNVTGLTREEFIKAYRGTIRDELLYSINDNPNFIARNFFDLPEYKKRLELVKENLAYIDEKYPEFDICIENDLPCRSLGSVLSETLISYNHKLCLDTGHLFAAEVVHKRDFLEEAEKIIRTGKVLCTHFHASLVKKDATPLAVTDGHENIYTESDLDLKSLLKIMLSHNVNDFIFETPKGNIKDFETFLLWKNELEAIPQHPIID